MKKTIRLLALIMCIIVCITMLSACNYKSIPREAFNAKMFLENCGDAGTALKFYQDGQINEELAMATCDDLFHPQSNLDAVAFFDYIETIYYDKYASFDRDSFSIKQIQIKSFHLGEFMSYNMELGGYTYQFEMQLTIQEIEHNILLLLLSNEQGMGIYCFEC